MLGSAATAAPGKFNPSWGTQAALEHGHERQGTREVMGRRACLSVHMSVSTCAKVCVCVCVWNGEGKMTFTEGGED